MERVTYSWLTERVRIFKVKTNLVAATAFPRPLCQSGTRSFPRDWTGSFWDIINCQLNLPGPSLVWTIFKLTAENSVLLLFREAEEVVTADGPMAVSVAWYRGESEIATDVSGQYPESSLFWNLVPCTRLHAIISHKTEEAVCSENILNIRTHSVANRTVIWSKSRWNV
jgi:hypothetical protein